MPKVFTVEPVKNHLEKNGSRLLCHSWVANSEKNTMGRLRAKDNQTINQFYVPHATQYKQQNA